MGALEAGDLESRGLSSSSWLLSSTVAVGLTPPDCGQVAPSGMASGMASGVFQRMLLAPRGTLVGGLSLLHTKR